MLEQSTSILEAVPLSSVESHETYKKAFIDLGGDNPYYSLELLHSNVPDQELYCFYFYQKGTLRALMPFDFRKIVLDGKETGFYDVSSPYGYNGPLFGEQMTKDEKMLFWDTLDGWYSRNKVVTEFLRFNFSENHLEYTGIATHTLKNVRGDITDFDLFWSNLKSKTRNQYRKAEKTGLKFEIHNKVINREKIEHFYQLYIGTMDRRQATDAFYHSMEYFISFCENNIDRVAIGLVYLNNIPISGELFLLSNDTMFSYLGGTDSDYFKFRPNEYLKITAIKWAKELGLRYYLIGGGKADGDDLYLYKKKFFPFDRDLNFFTGRKIIDKKIYKKLLNNFESSFDAMKIDKGFFPKYREA